MMSLIGTKTLCLTTLAAFFTISNVPYAQSESSFYITKSLLPFCKSAIASNQSSSARTSFLEGVCLGLISTSISYGRVMNDQFKFCAPMDLNAKTFIPILEAFVLINPIAMDSNIRDVANYVGRITYPCR
jgi:hypothetical protein